MFYTKSFCFQLITKSYKQTTLDLKTEKLMIFYFLIYNFTTLKNKKKFFKTFKTAKKVNFEIAIYIISYKNNLRHGT